jgi:DNA modification methylase
MRRPMLNKREPGDFVYEPFLGSGTTLIAAESAGHWRNNFRIPAV